MKHNILAISAGFISGALAMASMSGSNIAVFYLSLVHPLPLFYAGLSLGTQGALIAVGVATAIVAFANPLAGLVFAVLYGVPVWVITRLMLTGPNGPVWSIPEDQGGAHQPEGPQTQSTFADRITGRVEDWEGESGAGPRGLARDLGWYPAGWILAIVTAIGAGFIVIASVLTGFGLEAHVQGALSEFADAFAAPQGEEILKDALNRIAPFFAGMAAAMWAFGLLINVAIAQGLLAKGGRNIRPSPRFRELKLPDALSWALVASALVALVAPGELEYVGRNIAIVLAVPFFFLGLTVVHKLAALTPFPGAMLAMAYLLVIFSGWFVLVIAGLGILEQWVGLRNRMNTPNQT